jgi:hypothetical protein
LYQVWYWPINMWAVIVHVISHINIHISSEVNIHVSTTLTSISAAMSLSWWCTSSIYDEWYPMFMRYWAWVRLHELKAILWRFRNVMDCVNLWRICKIITQVNLWCSIHDVIKNYHRCFLWWIFDVLLWTLIIMD